MTVTTQPIELGKHEPITADKAVTEAPALDTVGVEFEYPIADSAANAPATFARTSSPARDCFDYHEPVTAIEGVPGGELQREHTGVEIPSAQLDLHSMEPEVWYNGIINELEAAGHPFAASGAGDTNFGLHTHLSELPPEDAQGLFDMSQEHWFRIFVCSSVMPESADPWRHGGVSSMEIDPHTNTEFDGQYVVNARENRFDDSVPDRQAGHFEWRLPEPMMPEHFQLFMRFCRILSLEGHAEAKAFARDLVEAGDDRLTAIRQYRMYKERLGENWPNAEARGTGSNSRPRADTGAAEALVEFAEE